MPTKGSNKIETVPLPERPVPYEAIFPRDTWQLLGDPVSFLVRSPWVMGIRVPSTLMEATLRNRLAASTSLLLLPGSTLAIGAWPTPEQPLMLEYQLSAKLIETLGAEVRVVVQEPWAIAATVPPALVVKQLRGLLGKKDRLMLVP
jgi:hypothetical protein